jgi:murein DD-endopeptidase MepM/ murein hydrolase activator NlpD
MRFLAGVFVFLLLFCVGYGFFITVNFPAFYPEETLALEEKIFEVFQGITLPLKLAKLSIKNPDDHVLMPVYEVRVSQVNDTWGAYRGEERVHEGQDIFAPLGTPVFSATFGYVTRIRHTELGGNVVYIAGAGGRRYYYAHLERFPEGLKTGQSVTQDTVIGFVGNSGNAETTPSHLHFGIYYHRIAIDPLIVLTDRMHTPSEIAIE